MTTTQITPRRKHLVARCKTCEYLCEPSDGFVFIDGLGDHVDGVCMDCFAQTEDALRKMPLLQRAVETIVTTATGKVFFDYTPLFGDLETNK